MTAFPLWLFVVSMAVKYIWSKARWEFQFSKTGGFFFLIGSEYSTNEGSNSLFSWWSILSLSVLLWIRTSYVAPVAERKLLCKANQRPATAASLLRARAKSRRRNPGKSTATSKSSDRAIDLARPHRLAAAAVIHFRPKRRDSYSPWQTEQEK